MGPSNDTDLSRRVTLNYSRLFLEILVTLELNLTYTPMGFHCVQVTKLLKGLIK